MTSAIYHGWLAGSTDSVQMPSKLFNYGYLKAKDDNTGNVYIGSSSDVSIAGTSDTNATTGFCLDAGEVFPFDTPGLPLFDLANLWYISDNAGDDLTYILYRNA
jgi:hypothetical protein